MNHLNPSSFFLCVENFTYRKKIRCGSKILLFFLKLFPEKSKGINHFLLQFFLNYFFITRFITEILHPLKIRNRHSSAICQYVRNNQNSFLMKNLISFRSGWTV